jgi:hypothetical protein
VAKDSKGNAYTSEAQSKAQANYAERRRIRDDALIARQEARAARSDDQQLARLDELFGPGVGAKKERARLLSRIEERKNKDRSKKNLPPVKEFVKAARKAKHDSLDLKNNPT